MKDSQHHFHCREMQSKTTMYHFTPVKWLQSKSLQNNKRKICGEKEPLTADCSENHNLNAIHGEQCEDSL